jgi:hypothetical protein
MMEHIKFAAKVAVVILVIYQIAPVRDAITRNYLGQ